MATHFSILSWEIQWTEETGGLQFMGLQKVRRDLATKPPTTARDIINVLRMSSHLDNRRGY